MEGYQQSFCMKDEALWLKDEKKRLKVRQEKKGFSSDAIGKLKRLRQTDSKT